MLDECVFKSCGLGCVTASHADRVLIRHCQFLNNFHSCILLEATFAIVTHTLVSDCQGNAINANKGTELTVSHCSLRKTDYPPLAICDGAIAKIKKSVMSESKMSGIVVRNGSKAEIKKCTVENIAQMGIVVSDSQDVTISSTTIINCTEAAIASYNHSRVHVLSSFLIGPCRMGFNIFTGGFVYGVENAIAGMRETGIWLHHGGSGRFVSTFIDTVVCESKEGMVERIRAIPLKLRGVDIPDDQLFRAESDRSFIFTSSFVVGRGIVDIVRNSDSSPPQCGLNAVKPTCKVCGAEGDCFFSLCGHSLYCRGCWESLAEKPTNCELCLMPIDKVCVPINCSHDEEEATCGICLCEPVDAIVVPCGHLICSACGTTWFEQHNQCPYCRVMVARHRTFVSYG
jgi:parallel beta-helix repeat protein